MDDIILFTSVVNITLTVVILGLILIRHHKAVLIFSLLTFNYNIVGMMIDDSQGLLFYAGAAFTDVVIITLLRSLDKLDQLVIKLQNVCKWFIYINLLGWVLWVSYINPIVYNIACTILYLRAIVFIYKDGVRDVYGSHELDNRDSGVLSTGKRRKF